MTEESASVSPAESFSSFLLLIAASWPGTNKDSQASTFSPEDSTTLRTDFGICGSILNFDCWCLDFETILGLGIPFAFFFRWRLFWVVLLRLLIAACSKFKFCKIVKEDILNTFCLTLILLFTLDQYQLSGAGGPCSLHATPHRLQHHSNCKIQSGHHGAQKYPMGSVFWVH